MKINDTLLAIYHSAHPFLHPCARAPESSKGHLPQRKINNSGSHKGNPASLSPLMGPLESLWDYTSFCRTLGVYPGVYIPEVW